MGADARTGPDGVIDPRLHQRAYVQRRRHDRLVTEYLVAWEEGKEPVWVLEAGKKGAQTWDYLDADKIAAELNAAGYGFAYAALLAPGAGPLFFARRDLNRAAALEESVTPGGRRAISTTDALAQWMEAHDA